LKSYTYLPIEEKTKEIYRDYNKKKFKDITEKWVKFLRSDRYRKKNSFILWHLAGRDWGKTAEAFKEINLLLEKNRKRFVQILKAPTDFIENIEKACPEEYKGRFQSLPKLRFLRKNAILIIDEGLLGANAKEALTKEMRRLSKFTSKSRHPNIIVIINSVNLGILGEFKDMIDITIYKHLGFQFFIRNKGRDPFIDQHEKLLSHLKEWEGIIISSYKKFNYEKGKISLKYEDYCPWFNDNLSLNQQDTNPDADFEDEIQLSKEIERLAKMAVNELGYRLLRPLAGRKLKGWLQAEHKELYYDFEKYIPRILTLAYYMVEEMIDQTNQKKDNEFVDIIEMLIREKGSEFKHKGVNYLKNWLYEQFPDIYHPHKNNINRIFNIYLDSLDKQKQQKKGAKVNIKREEKIQNIIKSLEKIDWGYIEQEAEDKTRKTLFFKEDGKKEEAFEILYERKGGISWKEIAKKYHMSEINVRKIIDKIKGRKENTQFGDYVTGSVNYHKGKIFERDCKKTIEKIFGNADWDGRPGKPDLCAEDLNNNDFYIFSLKNLKIKNKSYLTIDDLWPEIQHNIKKSAGRKYRNVFMYLIILNNELNKIAVISYDYRKPFNLNLNEYF